MALGEFAQAAALSRSRCFERRRRLARAAQRVRRRRQVRCRSDRRADRSGADRPAPCDDICRAVRGNVASACASPALPGRGRGPRRIARSSVATASVPQAEPQQRMLEQRQQRHRRRPSSAAAAASRANMPAGVSASASPPESSAVDVPARQRREHAAAERAVGRDQRRSLAILQASRNATAMARASSSALAASIIAMVSSAASV